MPILTRLAERPFYRRTAGTSGYVCEVSLMLLMVSCCEQYSALWEGEDGRRIPPRRYAYFEKPSMAKSRLREMERPIQRSASCPFRYIRRSWKGMPNWLASDAQRETVPRQQGTSIRRAVRLRGLLVTMISWSFFSISA